MRTFFDHIREAIEKKQATHHYKIATNYRSASRSLARFTALEGIETLSLSDTDIIGADGSSLIASGTCYILARHRTLSVSTTYMKLNGGYAAIDNRGGSLTVTDANIIIQQGGPAILTATGVKGMANSGRKQDSYDLSGRKQTRNAPRGIFITAGRKVATR